MTDLNQQTEQLLKALNTLHTDFAGLNLTVMITGAFVIALLMIIAFRQRR